MVYLYWQTVLSMPLWPMKGRLMEQASIVYFYRTLYTIRQTPSADEAPSG